MNEKSIFSSFTERGLTPVFVVIIPFLLIWVALSAGWETALGIAGFGIMVALSFFETRILIIVTILVFTLNQTNLFGGSLLLQNARWAMLGLSAVRAGFGIFSHKMERKLKIFDLIAIIGLLYAFASMTYSSDPNLTFQRSASLLLLYIAIFWLLWAYAHQKGEEKLVRILILAGIIVFGSNVLFALFPEGWQGDGRFRGIMPNPNAVGLLAAVYVPLLVWGGIRYKSYLSLLGLISAIICTLFSGSRNGLLSISVSLLYLAIVARSSRLVVAGVVSINILIGLIFLGSFDIVIQSIPTLNRIFDNTYYDYSSGRFDAWNDVLFQIDDNVLRGHGFGIDAIGVYSLGGERVQSAGVHNTYLQNLFQLGVIGTILFIVPLVLLALNNFRFAFQEPKLSLIHVLHAVLIAGLVSAIFENWIYSPGNAFTFPFWVCVMLLLFKQTQQKSSSPST